MEERIMIISGIKLGAYYEEEDGIFTLLDEGLDVISELNDNISEVISIDSHY